MCLAFFNARKISRSLQSWKNIQLFFLPVIDGFEFVSFTCMSLFYSKHQKDLLFIKNIGYAIPYGTISHCLCSVLNRYISVYRYTALQFAIEIRPPILGEKQNSENLEDSYRRSQKIFSDYLVRHTTVQKSQTTRFWSSFRLPNLVER